MEKYYREQNPTGLRFNIGNHGGFPPHIHEDIEIMCCRTGTHSTNIDGKDYLLKPGSILLVCPNQVHSFTPTSNPGTHYTLIVKPSLLGSYGQFLQANMPVMPVLETTPESPVWQLLELCYQEFKTNTEQPLLYTLLQGVFGMLCRDMDFSAVLSASQRSIRGILQYCANHFREDISVKKLSQALFLSQSHISHIFSEKLKISFPEYINSLRTAEAARLLESGYCSVSEAANLSGFTTIRTFNRAFRKRYGVSPSAYKKGR